MLRRVSISRGDFSGPCFECSDVSVFTEPICETLKSKFAKNYSGDEPRELVAYYDLHPVVAPGRWLGLVKRQIRRGLGASCFRRVWIVDLRSGSVLWVYPSWRGK
jgi:hypothetical protein